MYRRLYILTSVKAIRAKLFRNGGSQAVRLPRECRLPEGESEVMVRREGRRIILEPVDEWSDEFLNTFGSVSGELPRPKQRPLSDLENPFGMRGAQSEGGSVPAHRNRGGKPTPASHLARVKRVPVASGRVVSVGYDEHARVLEIELKGGAVYRYRDVPQAVHVALMRARSIDAFIDSKVQPRYQVEA